MTAERPIRTAEAGIRSRPRIDLAPLYEKYKDRLERHARAVLPHYLRPDSENALMKVFAHLASLQAVDRLPEPDNWEAYLVRSVTNACKDILKARRETPAQIDDDDPILYGDAQPDPTSQQVVDKLEKADRVRIVREAIQSLDERSQTIVIGKYYSGQNNRELGRRLGLTGQRVGQLHNEALRQLREEVNRRK